MESKREPDPRWASFIEYLDSENKIVGFTLPNNDHLFKYNSEGGWLDQQGNYYNAEGILQDTQKEEDSAQDEQDDQSYRDDEIVDQFQELLKEEELGISRKPIKKQTQPKPIIEEEPKPQPTKQKEEFDFKSQIQKYLKKEHLKEGLSQELFIYFKQKPKYFEEIVPQVQKRQSVDNKNEAIKIIKQKVEAKRVKIIENNKWLAVQGVFLDISGSSETTSEYDRYWYGHIKTNANQYLGLIEQVKKSEQFSLLEIKTFYALKSKFYLKKSQQKVKNNIKELKEKVNAAAQNQSIEFVLDSLPEYFPLSFVYDLVDYIGGNTQDIEEVYANDQFSATLYVLKETALKLVNIEGYNHDKGEFIQLEVKKVRQRFYYVGVDSDHKLPERELNDTLALEISKNELAKVHTAEQQKATKIRFALGSAWALRRVLMFRGESLNVILVKSKI